MLSGTTPPSIMTRVLSTPDVCDCLPRTTDAVGVTLFFPTLYDLVSSSNKRVLPVYTTGAFYDKGSTFFLP